jgi:hypothetical protein
MAEGIKMMAYRGKFPRIYLQPLNTPLYWRDEMSGFLPDAMLAYLNHVSAPTRFPPPNQEQFDIVKEYLIYVVNAPCWLDSPTEPFLNQLRESAHQIQTISDLQTFIHQALRQGLDLI